MEFFLKNKVLSVIILILAGFLVVAALNLKNAQISGELNINGIIPPSSTISIYTHGENEKNYVEVLSGLPAQDKAVWRIPNLQMGKTYYLKASLLFNNEKVASSQEYLITAPAKEETITINSPWKQANKKAEIGSIEGNFDLNGALGDSSYISLFVKKSSESDYTVVAAKLKAVDGGHWEYRDATKGEEYEVKAVLYVNDQYAGESTITKVIAPAYNEVLKINSQYRSEPAKVSLRGSLAVNGPTNSNYVVSILKKSTSDSDWVKVLDNLTAQDGTIWVWNSAVSGQIYQIEAVVSLNSNVVAVSQILTVAAPADNEILKIDLGQNGKATPQPVNSPTVSCVNQNNGFWTGNIYFQSVNTANRYWLQVGTQQYGNDMADYKVNSNGQNQYMYSVNNLRNGTTYYAQYAASTCTNCNNPSQFSQFSNVLTFSCSQQQPTPTPSPLPPPPTYTPYPTSTPYPTFTPVPTEEKKVSKCNETCGGSGYSCDDGLQCVSGGLIGDSVCRNPDCQDETDCVCKDQ